MLPLLLAAAAVPSIYKGIKGMIQGNEADKLKLRDTTPLAFRESLAMDRQAEAAGLPGQGTAINQLDAGQEAALSAGLRAGTNSGSILDLLARTDQNRTKGLADLGARNDAYHQQQTHHLQGLLQQQASYQLADQQTLDKNRGALREAADKNIYGALDGLSQVGTYGLSKMDALKGANPQAGLFKSDLLKTAANKLAADSTAPTTGVDDILSRRRNRNNAYGVPTYYDLPLGSNVA
jgi:hypothetical protein